MGCFLDYKIIDSKTVVNQVHEIHAEGMLLSETFQVAVIIEKSSLALKDFNNYFKHERKEMSMANLIIRLRIK